MPDVLVRIEAVNLVTFIEDCPDLKVIRGGSLMLRDAPLLIGTYLRGSGRTVRSLSVGGSIGLYRVRTTEAAEQLRDTLEGWLARHELLRFASLVVDVVPWTGDWTADRERVLAANRRRQMEAPRVVYPFPPPAEERGEEAVCQVDRVRPAWRGTPRGQTSPVTALREREGRRLRQEFYRLEAGEEYADLEFTDDLGSLSGGAREEPLAGKMAILYMDGNKFGSLQARFTSAEDQERWDQYLREERRRVLRALLDWARKDVRWLAVTGAIRLETLLWGGDEFRIVVPAWLGWETLAFLYEQLATLSFTYQAGGQTRTEPLTLAAGMVFCHAKAPIHPVNRLAGHLATLAKESVPSAGLAGQFFCYQVLESFDQIGKDFFGSLEERFGFLKTQANRNTHLGGGEVGAERSPRHLLVLDGTRMGEIRSLFSEVQEELPRRKLIALAQALASGQTGVKELLAELQGAKAPGLAELVSLLGGEPSGYFHMAELWDYIPSEGGSV